MTEAATVGVIVPAYNPGQRLSTALTSVLNQTFDDWQLVVVDDGGVEDLGWVAGLDARIRVHRQPNAGVSAARNVGVSLCSSPLVAFLDQDDEWLPGKLSSQIAGVGEAVFSHTDFWWVREGDARLARHDGAVTYTSVLAGGPPCLSSLLVSRRAFLQVGGFNELLAQTQDYDLALRLLMRGRAHHVATPLVRYHLHDSNASRDYAAGRAERRLILQLHALHTKGADGEAVRRAVREGLRRCDSLYAAQAFDMARAARRGQRGRREAVRAFLQALRWDPVSVIRSLGGVRPLRRDVSRRGRN